MTNEEFDRTKEFILKQQAQFAVNIEKLEETQTFIIEKLAYASAVLAESSKTIEKLGESQALTDEKLRNLIAVVDRHVSDGHNHLEN